MAYTLQSLLGSGGFATVVVAKTASGELRALKVLERRRCTEPGSVARFRDEARILARVRHPAVVHAHALHCYGDRLVMELDYVDGLSITAVLGPPPHRLPLPETLGIVGVVAEALWSAYQDPWGEDGQPMHIVHRDVHPSNIMLDRHGRVRILDFGIAKGSFRGREAMSLYDVGGTLGYIAPERKSGDASPAVDVYALAAMVVHLLGERLLLPQRSSGHDAVAKEVIARLDLPTPPLAELLDEMLRFDPAARPSMGDVAERLTALRAQLPPADLEGLARERVVPRLVAPPRLDARNHPGFADIAFLETSEPDVPLGQLSVPEGRRRLRALLAQPDWVRRLDEVKRVSRASDPWVETPLLDVLARVRSTWWRPLARRATAEEAEAALLILGDRPTEATLRAAAELVDHDDERIRKAARFVVARGREGA